MPSRATRAALCTMLVTATGCSAVFVRPSPHADGADGRPTCGTDAQWLFPVIDLAGGAAFAVGSYLATGIANGSNGYNGCDSNPALCRHSSPTAGYVVAGALAVSAVYGLAARSSCAAQVDASSRLPVEALDAGLREQAADGRPAEFLRSH